MQNYRTLRRRIFFCIAVAARVQRNSSTLMRVLKQRTNEHWTTQKTCSRRRIITSVPDDRHLFCMAVNDNTASSSRLTARWSTGGCALILASSISRRLLHRKMLVRMNLYRILLTGNHRQLRVQWPHEHRTWENVWHQAVFSGESHFNLWDYDVRMLCHRVRYRMI